MSTKLQNLATFWQNFGLSEVQKGLDDVATEITARQDESDVSRKALIELLRDFKKSSSEEVRSSCQPVVKSFQNEIDALAKRAKAAEKAFFDIYRTVADIPDPLPILEQSVDRNQQLNSKIQDYEIETNTIRETMGDMAKEITELKTKEKKMIELQSLVAQYDKNIDETMKEKLAGEVDKIQADFDDKLQLVEDEKETLAKKCKEAETASKSTHHLLEQAQSELYESNLKLSQKSDANHEEVEMLLNDLEAANQRAISAEKECDSLRETMATLTSVEKQIEPMTSDANDQLQKELLSMEKEVERLTKDLNKITDEAKRSEDDNRNNLEKWNFEKMNMSEEIKVLQENLQKMSDYEAIKKDLGILRSLEFGDEESDQKPLEIMILERSKTLQKENTSLRMEKERANSELVVLKAQFEEKVGENDRNAQLVCELEDHVERLQEHVNRGEAEGRSSADILYELDLSATKNGRESPTSISSSFYDKTESSASSLLPIIQAQRERYKKRNEELEDQQGKQQQQMALLQTEVKGLQADNVKLYEKIRFLQGYQVS